MANLSFPLRWTQPYSSPASEGYSKLSTYRKDEWIVLFEI